VISVEQLRHRYPGTQSEALRGIDLKVREGSLFGLLGPNGAGKTTLLSLLTGVLRLQEPGRIAIGGLSLREHLSEVQACCSLVPQDYAFYPKLSARENLAFFGGVRGLAGAELERRIDACLSFGALESVADRQARTYSGGLKRRLNLAIGLLNRPRLLFLDEPTVGIDLQSRAFILESIRELNRQGATIVYTSHYMEEVQQLCDEVAILDAGAVLVQDRLVALLARGGVGRVRVELETALRTQQHDMLRARLGSDLDVRGLVLTFDGDDARLSAILAALRAAGAPLRSVQYGRRNLEDLFLELTQRSLRD
jgi:ABC-2 type transport system ATP-binding protein